MGGPGSGPSKRGGKNSQKHFVTFGTKLTMKKGEEYENLTENVKIS